MSYVGCIVNVDEHIVIRRSDDHIELRDERDVAIFIPAQLTPVVCRHMLNVAAEIQHAPAAPAHRSPLQERITYWRRKLGFHR